MKYICEECEVEMFETRLSWELWKPTDDLSLCCPKCNKWAIIPNWNKKDANN